MSVLYVLIVLLPLLAAICIALLGRRLGESSGSVASAAIGLSLVWSVAAFVEIAREELAQASMEIEGVMEGWGFYEGEGYYADNPDARISGDPRDEWHCEASS